MEVIKNLAILAPGKNTITETFIAAHRELPFNITYIYGGSIPHINEKYGLSKFKKIKFGIIKALNLFISNISPELYLLENELKKNKIDVVLAEFGQTAAHTIRAIKKNRCKLIVHFHGADASIYDVLKKLKQQYLEVFEYSSSVIAVSNVMYNTLLELGCPKEKLILNHYGPKEVFSAINPDFESKNFIAVGRFVDKKAPYLTILAFRQVVCEYSDAILTFIGDGHLLDSCKNLAKYLNIERNVRFLGAQPVDRVIDEFKKSIAFVQHSIIAENGDSEGTPVAILEAQASGLPVISTYHAGIPDVVINAKTGYLVKEHDVKSMSDFMLRILNNPEETKKMSISAKTNIKNHFTLKRHLDALTKCINNS